MLVSDYIAEFLEKEGVTDCFTVVGGGAMYLNNSLGHRNKLKCTYFHHEQAAAMAAESYARLEGRVAAVCTTSGPGGTNAITGVLGGWLDSIPMFIISGQVKYETTSEYFHEKCERAYKLRSLGDQEYDITAMTSHICKYAVMVKRAEDIRYIMEKAWSLMRSGRPGPVWIDVPVDIQAMNVEPETLRGFDGCEISQLQGDDYLLADEKRDINSKERTNSFSAQIDGVYAVSDDTIRHVLAEIESAQRPVIYAGGGVRISGGCSSFSKMVKKLGIPVCTYWNSIDLMADDDPLYCGRGGNMGDRAGNFAVQNSDLCLVLGSRLSIRQVGYNYKTWARAAKVIMVDIDRAEMEKHTIHVDMKIHGDVKQFCDKMNEAIDEEIRSREALKGTESDMADACYFTADIDSWRQQCLTWKKKYPVVSEKQLSTDGERPNVYGFFKTLSSELPEGSLTASSNGACCVAGHQSYVIKKGTRFIVSNAVASMGYGLPAAIGLCIASGKRETICLEGDGSIMMNLQELQTVITNKLPIKIFLINNEGYHSIRITQNNIFPDSTKVGIGPESGDLSFPRFEALAEAFGYRYFAIRQGKEMARKIKEVLAFDGACICEVMTDTVQVWDPKNSARREADGSITSAPLEDLAPFLPREELTDNMYI